MKKYLSYLIENQLIRYHGDKTINTKGGAQKIKTYTITNIWKTNIDHYERGVKKEHPFNKGGSTPQPKGGQNSTPKKNQREEENRKIVLTDQDREQRQRIVDAYKNIGGWT